MWDLPPEIITTILVRLPVKSLLRFRCVSKPWRSLIDGDYFTKLHLLHSAEANTNRSLILQSLCFLEADLDSLERLDTGNIEVNAGHVKGCCNGLVLLVSASEKMFLWNPNTRKTNGLPDPPPTSLKSDHFWRRHCELGYDSKHDDYKVVRVVQAGYDWPNDVSLFSETTIYSLKTNSWKKAAGDFPHETIHDRSGFVCLNDALHFFVEHYSGSEVKIMAFDLAKEEYNELPLPESVAGRVLGFSLASAGGCLLFVVGNRTGRVWVMKEYGVKGYWCKLTNCFDGPEKEDCVSLGSLAFSNTWEKGLYNYKGTRRYWYRMGNNTTVFVAHVEGLSGFLDVDVVFGRSFNAWVCVASLVSPFCPCEVGEKEKEVGKVVAFGRFVFVKTWKRLFCGLSSSKCLIVA